MNLKWRHDDKSSDPFSVHSMSRWSMILDDRAHDDLWLYGWRILQNHPHCPWKCTQWKMKDEVQKNQFHVRSSFESISFRFDVLNSKERGIQFYFLKKLHTKLFLTWFEAVWDSFKHVFSRIHAVSSDSRHLKICISIEQSIRNFSDLTSFINMKIWEEFLKKTASHYSNRRH